MKKKLTLLSKTLRISLKTLKSNNVTLFILSKGSKICLSILIAFGYEFSKLS